ncbi:DUF1684 domain-containing protein [bacterium]|nr:DUF1684 domain-containing protein [bacterium]
MDLDALDLHRAEHDLFLKEHYASPLDEADQETFAGLDYFAPDPAWVIAGVFHESEPTEVPIVASSGTRSHYTMVGEVAAVVGGREYRLAVLDDGDGGSFIPFRDGTAGDTTYRGGRYVSPEVADDGSTIIDFNRAFNPWCVYDDEFICPLPPPANLIEVPISAGEMIWRRSTG